MSLALENKINICVNNIPYKEGGGWGGGVTERS